MTRKSSCVNARGIPPAAQQVLAMLSCLGGGGDPIPGQVGGVPHPRLGGTPSQVQGWYPIPGLGGYSIPGLGRVPHPRSGEGTPSHVWRWRGIHPIQTWDGVPPPLSRPGMGYPPDQTWDGVSPQT